MHHILLWLLLYLANAFALAEVHSIQHNKATQQYYSFSVERVKNAEEMLERLSRKLEAGEVEAAKEDYIKAHYQYESVRPLILLFPNLNNLVDIRINDLPNDPNDINFIGFHALEYELFIKHDIARSLVESKKLINNLEVMIHFLEHQEITFKHMIDLWPKFIRQILVHKLPGHDSLYSCSGLGEIAANMKGIHLIVHQTRSLFPEPLYQEFAQVENNIEAILYRYRSGDLHQPYSKLTNKDRELLKQAVIHLDHLLIQMNEILSKTLE